MITNAAIRILKPLAPSANANPLDVLKMTAALGALGHYAAPDWGLSQFPDPALFKAIQAFQRKRGLKVDGVMKPGGPTEVSLRETLTPQQTGAALYATARTIQAQGQNGDTLLAHITPEEAHLLDAITDGASINPATGLLEFWSTKGGYSGPDRTHTPKESGISRSFDASADQKENQAAANRAFTREGNGRDNSADTRASGGKDTLGGGNSLTAPSTNKSAPSTKAEQDVAAARRARTVLTPDNDPSFTAGFLEAKQKEEKRKGASLQTDEKSSGMLSNNLNPKAPSINDYEHEGAITTRNNVQGTSTGPTTRGGARRQPSQPTGFSAGLMARPNNYSDQSNNLLSKAIRSVGKGYVNATSWHFEDRDLLNSPLPKDEKQAISMGFERYPADQSIFHQNNIGKEEKKYGHPDGREVVFDGDSGMIVTNDQYRGTYNYEVPSPLPKRIYDMKAWQDYVQNGGEHFIKDIAPYLIGGNVRGRY